MSQTPLISIVIPAYNRAHKLEAAIKSIQSQTFSSWEAIIVDDGSKDNTVEVAKELTKNPQVHFIRYEKNKGAQVARNTGIRAAKGEWIAFLDSDDQWLPESLEWRMNIALKEKTSVVHSEAYIILKDKPKDRYWLPPLKGHVYKNVLSKEGPMFQALLAKKSCFEKIGYLDERVPAFQEWDTAIRLAKYYEFGFEARPTFVYDGTSNDAISRSNLRNANGYAYIFHKHFWSILFHCGAEGMAIHCVNLSNWYEKGEDFKKSKSYKLMSIIWKLVSPLIISRKIKNVLRGK